MKFIVNTIITVLVLIALYAFWQNGGFSKASNEENSVTVIDEKTGEIRTQESTKKSCIDLPVIGNC